MKRFKKVFSREFRKEWNQQGCTKKYTPEVSNDDVNITVDIELPTAKKNFILVLGLPVKTRVQQYVVNPVTGEEIILKEHKL